MTFNKANPLRLNEQLIVFKVFGYSLDKLSLEGVLAVKDKVP